MGPLPMRAARIRREMLPVISPDGPVVLACIAHRRYAMVGAKNGPPQRSIDNATGPNTYNHHAQDSEVRCFQYTINEASMWGARPYSTWNLAKKP